MPYGPSSSCCTLTDLCCKQLLSAQAFIGRRISDRWDKAHMAPCAGLSSSLSSRVPIDPAVVANYWLVCQVLADLRQAVAAICGEANIESAECQGYSLCYICRQNGMDDPADPPGCSWDCAAASRPLFCSCGQSGIHCAEVSYALLALRHTSCDKLSADFALSCSLLPGCELDDAVEAKIQQPYDHVWMQHLAQQLCTVRHAADHPQHMAETL